MIPLALALIDSVFALALHHDERAKISLLADHECASVWASVSGPEPDGPIPGALLIRVSVKLVPHDTSRPVLDESVHVHLDLQDQRLLARELSLAELPLDRSGLARMVGELEAWCYARIPVFHLEDEHLDAAARVHEARRSRARGGPSINEKSAMLTSPSSPTPVIQAPKLL